MNNLVAANGETPADAAGMGMTDALEATMAVIDTH